MEGPVTELTLDEVRQILSLIEESDFDLLQLEVGNLKLTVSKKGYQASPAESPAEPPSQPGASSRASVKIDSKDGGAEKRIPETKPRSAAEEGFVPIRAPMVGTFYTAPEPGAPPFVQAGSSVDEDTTVGLIEVMKVFNAVKSGVKGAIAELCVQNGQFVEYGQTLFLVQPKEVPKEVLQEEVPLE